MLQSLLVSKSVSDVPVLTDAISTGMEIIAALDLFYDIRLNAAVAIFQIFATQMIGYGIAGMRMHFISFLSLLPTHRVTVRTLLVYPT